MPEPMKPACSRRRLPMSQARAPSMGVMSSFRSCPYKHNPIHYNQYKNAKYTIILKYFK